mmetsp:Transcript_32042/g.78018  ORF Transcript_32042/g.78018 Transcript_32042/m.78018 type:complete len:233 (+) Transcript_32042:3932-4630(+)
MVDLPKVQFRHHFLLLMQQFIEPVSFFLLEFKLLPFTLHPLLLVVTEERVLLGLVLGLEGLIVLWFQFDRLRDLFDQRDEFCRRLPCQRLDVPLEDEEVPCLDEDTDPCQCLLVLLVANGLVVDPIFPMSVRMDETLELCGRFGRRMVYCAGPTAAAGSFVLLLLAAIVVTTVIIIVITTGVTIFIDTFVFFFFFFVTIFTFVKNGGTCRQIILILPNIRWTEDQVLHLTRT